MKWRANIRAYLRTYEILVVINLCSLNTSVRQSAVKQMYRVFAYLKHSTEKQRGNPLDSSVDYYNDYKKDYYLCLCVLVSECVFENAEPLGWCNSPFNPTVQISENEQQNAELRTHNRQTAQTTPVCFTNTHIYKHTQIHTRTDIRLFRVTFSPAPFSPAPFPTVFSVHLSVYLPLLSSLIPSTFPIGLQ